MLVVFYLDRGVYPAADRNVEGLATRPRNAKRHVLLGLQRPAQP